MPALTKVEKPKTAGFIDRGYNHERKRKQLEEDEKEIARLEAEARGETLEDDAEDEDQTETPQEETQTEVPEVKTEETTETTEEDDTQLSAEEKSFKKRYGDLRRHMQTKEKEWEERFKALEAQNNSENILPPKTDEDLEQWAKKYPDVASIVTTLAQKEAQKLFEKADMRIQEFDKLTADAARVKAENAIREVHGDFDTLRASDDFHNWANEQPKWVQDALYENEDDPASVVRVIDLYKVDKGMTKTARKKSTKDAATAVNTRNKVSLDADSSQGSFSESQVAKMSLEEYSANETKIMEAQRKGRFIYDLSGGAR